MITLRRAKERRHVESGKHDVWQTFYPQDLPGPPTDGLGNLTSFDEIRFPPGGSSRSHRRDETEIVTYVYKGALAQQNTTGNSAVIRAGEFQRLTAGPGIRHKVTNASRSDWAHVFQVSLRPAEAGLECAREQQRFTVAQRRNVLCVIASPDGRKGSLRIHQDAFIYSSILDPGLHLVHELMTGRSDWIHIIYGEATLDDVILTQGDGVGVTAEPAVSMTVRENTEILLVDLGPTTDLFQNRSYPMSRQKERNATIDEQ